MENIILILALVICVVTDVKSRKILNIITLPTIILALLYHGIVGGFSGLLFSGTGFLVGLGLLFIPFAMGGIGAGDVKLLGAIGALKGAYFVFYAFLFAAAIGGLIALVMMLHHKQLGTFLKQIGFSFLYLRGKNLKSTVSSKDLAPSFPYGVAIAFGTVSTFFMGGLL